MSTAAGSLVESTAASLFVVLMIKSLLDSAMPARNSGRRHWLIVFWMSLPEAIAGRISHLKNLARSRIVASSSGSAMMTVSWLPRLNAGMALVLRKKASLISFKRLRSIKLPCGAIFVRPSCMLRALIWWLYADLKAYKRTPDRRRRYELRARFDRIFRRRTGFATLDRLLARLHANKEELLLVLERPEVPLHTDGSERDLRPQVIKRKISGGTRSDLRRDCRDAFLGLLLTCAKLDVSFWAYLGDRLGVPGAEAPY